jgi:MFS transporter, OFA family, oxalate/formate antiporter
MAMIANLQYGWTLFVNPIDSKYHWGRAAIQVAFTVFVLAETWLVRVEDWFVDRFGPRIVVLVGGARVSIAWIMNAVASFDLPLHQCRGWRHRRRCGLRHVHSATP